MFLIHHSAGDIGNKNITGNYREILVSVSFTYYSILGASVHTECYIYNSLVYIIYVLFIYMQ